jgi:hypothetical protein
LPFQLPPRNKRYPSPRKRLGTPRSGTHIRTQRPGRSASRRRQSARPSTIAWRRKDPAQNWAHITEPRIHFRSLIAPQPRLWAIQAATAGVVESRRRIAVSKKIKRTQNAVGLCNAMSVRLYIWPGGIRSSSFLTDRHCQDRQRALASDTRPSASNSMPFQIPESNRE